MHKKILLIVILFFISTGCNGRTNDSITNEKVIINKSESQKKIKYEIALVMKTLTNPFFVKMEEGARKAESKYNIELLVKTGAKETSIEQQIQIVEDLIIEKVDAIVIAPGSSTELVTILKKAQENGIKIVNIDNKLDEKLSKEKGLKDVPFISVKNDEGAYLAVKEICKDIGEDDKEALIFEGINEAENAKLRKSGAEKAFGEYPNIRIVSSESANWKIDEAYELAKVLLNKHSSAELIFCANDMMALGVIEYLKETGKKNVKVAGFDNLDDAQTEIKEGYMISTIDQQADLQGYKGIETAIRLLDGKKVENNTYVPVRVITKNTLQK
ncbi:MAG: substrate-binding domain-containing protein [Clostridiales bacterium]